MEIRFISRNHFSNDLIFADDVNFVVYFVSQQPGDIWTVRRMSRSRTAIPIDIKVMAINKIQSGELTSFYDCFFTKSYDQ